MQVQRYLALGLAASILACAPGDVKAGLGPNDPEAAVVVLAPAQDSIVVGEVVLIAASARTSTGQPAPAEIDWSADGGTLTTLTDSTAQFSALNAGSYTVRGRGRKAPHPKDSTVIVVDPPVSPVVSLSVAPGAVTLGVGGVQAFVVTATRQDGTTMTPGAIWSATGGTVDPAGIYRAGSSAGTYRVIAKQQGGSLADTAAVTLTATPPVLQAVVLTPSSASLATGGAQQFNVSGRWSDGSITPPSVTYSATGGTISPGGLYTAGTTAGTFRVIAKQQGGSLADTAVVTVATTTGSANECAFPQAGWVWCDDFEVDRIASYFEYDSAGGSFVRVAGVGEGGSAGMRAHFAAGQISAGSLKLAFGHTPQSYFRPVDSGTANYREIYWRIYLRNQPGWSGGGGDKLSRATIFSSTSTWAQAMIGHVWSGTGSSSDYLVVDPASGTDAAGNLVTITYNDFANLRWFGLVRGNTPLFDAAHVGSWYCVEVHVRLNTPGVSDGYMEYWINGGLEARTANLNWVGDYSAYGINAILLESYWNSGSPVAQERYLDRFVVSTSRIGC